MNTAPKISVIVPVYNAGKYLRPALESVLSQTFTDWECICVNDGSKDDSASIINEFVEINPKFILITQENGGVSKARNTGIDAARGEYVTFLDQDDLLAPDALQNYFDMAKKYNADMVRARYKKIPANFALSEYRPVGPLREKFYTNPKIDFINITNHRRNKIWAYIWICMFRRDVIKNVRFIPELRSGSEDSMFMAAMLEKIKNFVQIVNGALYYRKSEISTTFSGFKPVLIERFLITTPFVYKNYVIGKTSDDIWSAYIARKETRLIYYMLKRCIIKNKNIELARKIFRELNDKKYIQMQYLDMRQRMIFKLFIDGHVKLLRMLRFFI